MTDAVLSVDKLSATLTDKIPVTRSGWFTLYAEGEPTPFLDTAYPQASTNAIRIYTGDQKIRSKESAEYFVKWIDKLHSMADVWAMWRSQREKDHVYAQFAEARAIYQGFLKD